MKSKNALKAKDFKLPKSLKKYTIAELNKYGDVKEIKEGWTVAPLIRSKDAPVSYTFMMGWKKRGGYYNPIKKRVVPFCWWVEKCKKNKWIDELIGLKLLTNRYEYKVFL